MTALIIFACAAALCALGLTLGAYFSYRLAFKRKKGESPDPMSGLDRYPEYADVRRRNVEAFLSLPCEEVRIKSYDGLTLYARYYHVRDGADVAIKMHGYRSIAVRDFSSSVNEVIRAERNLLLVDHRAHGKSDGKVISFGINERRDCLSWIDYINKRFGAQTNIILFGISMGAATVIMAAGEPLPKNVRAVIADCPYSSQQEIIARVGANMGIPPFFGRIFARVGARLFARFSLTDTTPVEAVGRARLPILIIHGEADGFVPKEMSERLARENPAVSLITFPNADHALSYLSDPDRYESAVRDFIAAAKKSERN